MPGPAPCDDRAVLRLRIVDAADLDTLIGWFPDAAAVRDWAGPGQSWPLDPATLAAHAADPAVHSWAAWRPPDRRRLIGYLELVRLSPGAGRLDRVVIAPDQRGRRLGVPLVTAALDQARDLGLTTVDLLVFAENQPARRTYLAAGFTDHGGLPDYPSVHRMSVDLTASPPPDPAGRSRQA
jgi:RimJ/RimL family protein N-acetyltransferase